MRNAARMITYLMSLDELPAALEDLRAGEAVKVVVEFPVSA